MALQGFADVVAYAPALLVRIQRVADVHRVLEAVVPPVLIDVAPDEEHIGAGAPRELCLQRLLPRRWWLQEVFDLDIRVLLVPLLIQQLVPADHVPLADQAEGQFGRGALSEARRLERCRGGGWRLEGSQRHRATYGSRCSQEATSVHGSAGRDVWTVHLIRSPCGLRVFA